jgi:hypothetical protein
MEASALTIASVRHAYTSPAVRTFWEAMEGVVGAEAEANVGLAETFGRRGHRELVRERDAHESESDTDRDSLAMPVFAPPVRTRRKEAAPASPPFSPFSSIYRATTGHGDPLALAPSTHASPSPLSATFPVSLLITTPLAVPIP